MINVEELDRVLRSPVTFLLFEAPVVLYPDHLKHWPWPGHIFDYRDLILVYTSLLPPFYTYAAIIRLFYPHHGKHWRLCDRPQRTKRLTTDPSNNNRPSDG